MRRLLPLLLVLVLSTATAADAPLAGAGATFDTLIVTDRTIGTGIEAKPGMTLKVHYTGWIYDATAKDGHGKQFDSTTGRKPLTFPLGDPRLIAAWNQGIPGMRVGGKRELRIPPALGYGSKGTSDGVIPPDTALVFDIELMEALAR